MRKGKYLDANRNSSGFESEMSIAVFTKVLKIMTHSRDKFHLMERFHCPPGKHRTFLMVHRKMEEKIRKSN